MQATITWRPASEPPEHTRTVLIVTSCETAIGAHFEVDMGWLSVDTWFDSTGCPLFTVGVTVTHWAEMPAHPEQK